MSETIQAEPTHIGLVVRQQGWFRAFVDVETIPLFSSEEANSIIVHPTGTFRVRVLVGRGPVQHDLPSTAILWFGHGQEQYPAFTCPNIGPPGAGLYAKHKPQSVGALADEALCLIEVSIIQPVPKLLAEQFEKETEETNDTESMVQALVTEARKWLEQAVGLYALYQYPIVWEPLGVTPLVAFVDLEAKKLKPVTYTKKDNPIPFRLNVAPKLQDRQLIDDALGGLSQLGDGKFHLPLLLLQRTLWQKDVQLRFLETFLLLDYMTSQSTVQDAQRQGREELYSAIEGFIKKEYPEHEARIQGLKHVVLQAPQRQRMSDYFAHLGVVCDDGFLRRMVKLRNNLAHARNVDSTELTEIELKARVLARQVMRMELEAKGLTFGNSK